MAILPIDIQRISFSFPGANKPSGPDANATIYPSGPISFSAVDLTRAYIEHNATTSGSFRAQGVLPFDPPSIGSSCSGIAVPPLPGPIGLSGDLGVINDGKINEWRVTLTSPTTAVVERSGSPVPNPGAADGTDGCGHFFNSHIVEYL
jgi:hypothetical protein